MAPVEIIGLSIVSLGLIVRGAIALGGWLERQMRAAELREWKRQYYTEIAPLIPQPATDWPQAGYAMERFFGTSDIAAYDIRADVEEFMEQQDAATQKYLKEQQNEH